MDKRAFFDLCRRGVMGPTLDDNEVSGAEIILDAMAGAPISHCAYALATAWWETKHTMQPVREAYWLSPKAAERYFFRMYDIRGERPAKAKELGNLYPGDGALFCGRALPQITGRKNYATMGRVLGYPLEGNPDLAMRPDISAQILRVGMERGLFTGKAFDHFLPAEGPATDKQFFEARRIINGRDKAAEIAAIAVKFQDALRGAGW